jgi:hypothetical protein
MVLAHPETAVSLTEDFKELSTGGMPLINLLSDDALKSQLLPPASRWPRSPDELLRLRLSALGDLLKRRFGQQLDT